MRTQRLNDMNHLDHLNLIGQVVKVTIYDNDDQDHPMGVLVGTLNSVMVTRKETTIVMQASGGVSAPPYISFNPNAGFAEVAYK